MSARMHSEQAGWAGPADQGVKRASEIEVECLFRNLDAKDLVAPLRQMQPSEKSSRAKPDSEVKRQAALALQEQWESWLVQRELLRNEIKRGQEFLDNIHKEVSNLRARLEEWPAYERICGRNPVLDYMEAIAAHERVGQFLPEWLRRREAQLNTLNLQMEACAQQNGLEHLL